MDFDYYSGKDLTYPMRPKRPTLAAMHTSQDARDYADAMEQFESALVNYHAEMSDYNTKTMAREQELKDTLRNDYDLNEEQSNLLWNFAWEEGHEARLEGHSAGLSEVVNRFEDYYDLVNQFIKLEG
jgi:hypothetical protein